MKGNFRAPDMNVYLLHVEIIAARFPANDEIRGRHGSRGQHNWKEATQQPDPTGRDDKVVKMVPRGDNKIAKNEGLCYRGEYVWQGPEMSVMEDVASLPKSVPRRLRHVYQSPRDRVALQEAWRVKEDKVRDGHEDMARKEDSRGWMNALPQPGWVNGHGECTVHLVPILSRGPACGHWDRHCVGNDHVCSAWCEQT